MINHSTITVFDLAVDFVITIAFNLMVDLAPPTLWIFVIISLLDATQSTHGSVHMTLLQLLVASHLINQAQAGLCPACV